MGWKNTSDGDHKDKINVDLEKGRVTHERISKGGEKHDHEWSDTRGDSIKYGWRGENYSESDSNSSSDSSSSSSDSGDSRVICTHFFRTGLMTSALWRADMEFTRRLSPKTIRGYHLWAIPYVRFMRCHVWAERLMLPIATARAIEIAYIMGVAPRGSLLGKIIRRIGEPICWILGSLVAEQDWQSLYRRESTT